MQKHATAPPTMIRQPGPQTTIWTAPVVLTDVTAPAYVLESSTSD